MGYGDNDALYLSVNVFSTKVLIGDTIFYVSNWRRDRHFTWSSEPREGPAACRAKGVPSFLSYFKTLSIGPAPGVEPATSRSAVKHSIDWANPAAVMMITLFTSKTSSLAQVLKLIGETYYATSILINFWFMNNFPIKRC